MTSPRSSFPFIAPAGRSSWRAVPLLWRKRLAVLLAALTVPAMAATGGVGSLPGPAVESTAALATRQAAAAVGSRSLSISSGRRMVASASPTMNRVRAGMRTGLERRRGV
jgi:hypothetical protein